MSLLNFPLVHLRGGGTSVIVTLEGGRLPRILHWGADLGELDEAALRTVSLVSKPTIGDSLVTYPQPIPVIPQLAESWLGRPGVSGSRGGQAWAPLFRNAISTLDESPDRTVLLTDAEDPESQLRINIAMELYATGILRVSATISNDGDDYRVEALELALPVPDIAGEILNLTGRWSYERVPQRQPFTVGALTRESRGGKPGLDNSIVLLAGTPGFAFRSGTVWGVHLGWSGNQILSAERTPGGVRLLRGGELLLPDEVVLAPGASYQSPWLYGAWGDGVDALASRFHQFIRARPQHPTAPRPVLVNTWEAVYFDHNFQTLTQMAERSSALGVERFVLDDGWFLGRRDDTSSLGDWLVDPIVWPDGLKPLASRVHELGMEFGLWFEPEMVNLNSSLAREHPQWFFNAGHGAGVASRYQHVLDLGHEEAYKFIFDRISALVADVEIDFIKWDHNRYLTDAGHSPHGRPGVHRQTQQAYRMMDELRATFPHLEIESCASGGGRIDLGVLERTDRVWSSDCNDPHERLDIQRWTGLLLPPELQGTHIGAEQAHTTRRVSTLDFRAATAIWGNLGVELDLTRMSEDLFESVKKWLDFHKENRHLLHTGTVVHADMADLAFRFEGVVSADRRDSLYQFAVVHRPASWPPGKLQFAGLDPQALYFVEEVAPGSKVPKGQRPPWLESGVFLPGSVLMTIGIEAPLLDVDRSILIRAKVIS